MYMLTKYKYIKKIDYDDKSWFLINWACIGKPIKLKSQLKYKVKPNPLSPITYNWPAAPFKTPTKVS